MAAIPAARHRLRAALAAALCAALAAGCASSGGGSGKRARWDQERVTSYARQFAESVDQLQKALRAEPSILSLTQQRAHYQFREDVRLLDNSANRLLSELEAGKGYAETAPTYERMRALRRQAEENGRKAVIPEPTMAAIMHAGDLLNRLSLYYPDGGGTP